MGGGDLHRRAQLIRAASIVTLAWTLLGWGKAGLLVNSTMPARRKGALASYLFSQPFSRRGYGNFRSRSESGDGRGVYNTLRDLLRRGFNNAYSRHRRGDSSRATMPRKERDSRRCIASFHLISAYISLVVIRRFQVKFIDNSGVRKHLLQTVSFRSLDIFLLTLLFSAIDELSYLFLSFLTGGKAPLRGALAQKMEGDPSNQQNSATRVTPTTRSPDEECCICQGVVTGEKLYSYCRVPKHVAHFHCMQAWYHAQQDGFECCPICRQPLVFRSYWWDSFTVLLKNKYYWRDILARTVVTCAGAFGFAALYRVVNGVRKVSRKI
eukprot:Nk52_evm71s1737 gene=Nk52_evmTU71s1737